MHKTAFALPPEVLVAFALICAPGHAQQPRQYTAQDYAAAEKFMFYNLNPLAWKGVVNAAWLPGERFVYRAADESSYTYTLVDPAKRTTSPHVRSGQGRGGSQRSQHRAVDTDGAHLMASDLALSGDGRVLTLTAADAIYRCDLHRPARLLQGRLAGLRLARRFRPRLPPTADAPFARQELGAFIRDWNLWVRDIATGDETQLTTDGVKDFGYATDNAGWHTPTPPFSLWSPDSRKSPPSSRTSARPAMYPVQVTISHPSSRPGSIPSSATRTSR